MATTDNIRNQLIDKIRQIKNQDFLEVLDKLISINTSETSSFELSEEQKEVLKLSEEDISEGRVVKQEAMMKRNLEWLDAK